MVQAKWMRINPAQLMMPGTGKMSVMVMATAAKKHVTIFRRSRSAPGAGGPELTGAFRRAAKGTKNHRDRADRNQMIATAMRGQHSAGHSKRQTIAYTE
jgi:hypothetical protein